jgi:hypothetical protein
MGEQRSRTVNDQEGDASARPTIPEPSPSRRYRVVTNEERERDTIPPNDDPALTDDERIKKAHFEAIKRLRRTLSGR